MPLSQLVFDVDISVYVSNAICVENICQPCMLGDNPDGTLFGYSHDIFSNLQAISSNSMYVKVDKPILGNVQWLLS